MKCIFLRNVMLLLCSFVALGTMFAVRDLGQALAQQAAPAEELGMSFQDLADEPLPKGAVARLGTLRFYAPPPTVRVLFSPDGKMLASAAHVGEVRFWNPDAGSLIGKLSFSNSLSRTVQEIAFAPDGQRVCVVTGLKIRLYDIVADRVVRTYQLATGAYRLEFLPNGKTFVASGMDGTIRFCDVESGEERFRFSGHTGRVLAMAISPNGQLLASGDEHGNLRLWNIQQRSTIARLPRQAGKVLWLAFSPDGRRLCSSSDDRTVRVWTIGEEVELVHTLAHPGNVEAVAFSPDGKNIAAVARGRLIFWEAEAGAKLWERDCLLDTTLAFSPDGKTLATGGETSKLHLWDVDKKQRIERVQGHESWILSVAFSADSARLASAGRYRPPMLWDARKGDLLARMAIERGQASSMVSCESQGSFIVGAWDDSITFFDDKTGKVSKRLRPHSGAVASLALTRKGARLAIGGYNGMIDVRRLADERSVATFRAEENLGMCLAISPDGKMLVSGTSLDAIVWRDIASREVLRRIPVPTNEDVYAAFSPDGSVLATIGGTPGCTLWSVRENKRLGVIPSGWGDPCFSPDGRLIAFSTDLDSFVICDVKTRRVLLTVSEPDAMVTCTAFSHDGRLLATGRGDTTVLVWDVAALERNARRSRAKR